jgi:pyrroline-5-carboxylate reductase
MKTQTLGFIGAGRITRIFLQAFENKNLAIEKIAVYDPNKETLLKLKELFPGITAESELTTSTIGSDILFLAIHPPVMMETLSKIKSYLKKETIIVSLAPKITIAAMITALDGFNTIARLNPSATSVINQGINPIAFSPDMPRDARETLLGLLRNLGKVPQVKESKIEAYAIISAMGSTYFWFQLQQLKELAQKYGMDETEANETITEMLQGTVSTLFNSGLSPTQVMDLVPVKPLAEFEETIKSYYTSKLDSIFEKIKP